MTFQVILPLGGLAGWHLLERTKSTQLTTLSQSREIRNLTDHFRDNIRAVQTADDLIGDRRLLTVALTAFGLKDDLNSKAFIRKVLDEGSIDPKAFANRLADKRYLQLAKTFGFNDLPVPRTQLSTFADTVISKFISASFEASVGDRDRNMRLALSFATGISDLLATQKGGNARWFAVMGSPTLRKVIEGALGLPAQFAQLPLERQLNGFRCGLDKLTGSGEVASLSDPAIQDRMIRTFLIRAQAQSTVESPILTLFRL
jgi:hypothetical protein